MIGARLANDYAEPVISRETALANFVPFAGPISVQVGLFVFGGISLGLPDAIAPVLAVWLLNTIEGHFVTPWLVGRQVVLNPLAVFLAVAFGGWLWGIAGAVVAVPGLIVMASMLQHWWPVWATHSPQPEPTREILHRIPPLGTLFGAPR